ncbi:MAG: DUF169 domain-containing protein [Methanotrichaceae archaeon]
MKSIKETGDVIAQAVNLKTKLICVYGSDRIPERSIQASSISHCIAFSMYKMATGIVVGPIYVGYNQDKPICRCIGGPSWFGYKDFDPILPSIISVGSDDMKGSNPKYLKESKAVADETFSAVGKIYPIDRYVVMRRCEEIEDDTVVRSIVCFATGEQIRDLCALAHFRSNDVFGNVIVPWGPTCATLVTYPAGLSEKAPINRIFLGPTDPSAKEWLPEGYMAMGIPAEVAKIMADDIEKSFLSR